jgi:hypothetical protein
VKLTHQPVARPVRAAVFTAAAIGTVLSVTAAARRFQHRTAATNYDDAANYDDALAPAAGPWGELPCPPLREGVGYLHDWLASGDWTDPTEVLEVLRRQAPVRLVADLLRDLQTDLHAADYLGVAAQLHEAEQLLLRAAHLVGEVDYNPSAVPDAHPGNCPGGCGGTGQVMETMTWEIQGEGIYVPVHAEPVDCRAGQPEPAHGPDCRCLGTGAYDEDGYRHLCLGLGGPVVTGPQPTPGGQDPWAVSAPAGWSPGDEPPF